MLEVKPLITIKRFHSFFTQKVGADFAFLGESHDFWECVLVTDGSLCVSGDERVYDLSSGKMIFHKPNELHKFHVTSPNGASTFIFSFEMNGDLAPFFQNKVFLLDEHKLNIIDEMLEYALVGSKARADECKNGANAKAADVKEEENVKYFHFGEHEVMPTYYPTLASYVCRLFYSLAEDSQELSPSASSASALFYTAVRYMNDRLGTSVSVEEIAAHCGVSQSGLKRLFGKYAGMPIHKYFLTLKLNEATRLLQNGLSVCETAERLSFSSQNYFSTVYKREMNRLPSQVVRSDARQN